MHDTQYPVHAPFVYTWGGVSRPNKPIPVEEGQRRIKLVSHSPDMLFDDCCADPCGHYMPYGHRHENELTQQIMYFAGYKSPQDVPSGIVLGMLRFIAWSIMRPGDELLTQRNRTSISEGGITGSNNSAWASGALELWVQYDSLRF
jgi:hypothetical protein